MDPSVPSSSAVTSWKDAVQTSKKSQSFKFKDGSNIVDCTLCFSGIKCRRGYKREGIKRHVSTHLEKTNDSNRVVPCSICFKFVDRNLFDAHIDGHGTTAGKLRCSENFVVTNYCCTVSKLAPILQHLEAIKAPSSSFVEYSHPTLPRNSTFKACLIKKSPENFRKMWIKDFRDKPDDFSPLFRFKIYISTNKLCWNCCLCPENESNWKVGNELSLRMRVLRHMASHHSDNLKLQEVVSEEWNLISSELKCDALAVAEDKSLVDKERCPAHYVACSINPLYEPMIHEIVRRSPKLQEYATSSHWFMCLICFVVKSSYDQILMHCQAHWTLRPEQFFADGRSEFREVEEISTLEKLRSRIGVNSLCFSRVNRFIGENDGRAESFYKWRCPWPCGDNMEIGHCDDVYEFPSPQCLILFVLKHFDTYHTSVYSPEFLDYEWKCLCIRLKLSDKIRYFSPTKYFTGFSNSDPHDFLFPRFSMLLGSHGTTCRYLVCGFCFFCAINEEQFEDHILTHGYSRQETSIISGTVEALAKKSKVFERTSTDCPESELWKQGYPLHIFTNDATRFFYLDSPTPQSQNATFELGDNSFVDQLCSNLDLNHFDLMEKHALEFIRNFGENGNEHCPELSDIELERLPQIAGRIIRNDRPTESGRISGEIQTDAVQSNDGVMSHPAIMSVQPVREDPVPVKEPAVVQGEDCNLASKNSGSMESICKATKYNGHSTTGGPLSPEPTPSRSSEEQGNVQKESSPSLPSAEIVHQDEQREESASSEDNSTNIRNLEAVVETSTSVIPHAEPAQLINTEVKSSVAANVMINSGNPESSENTDPSNESESKDSDNSSSSSDTDSSDIFEVSDYGDEVDLGNKCRERKKRRRTLNQKFPAKKRKISATSSATVSDSAGVANETPGPSNATVPSNESVQMRARSLLEKPCSTTVDILEQMRHCRCYFCAKPVRTTNGMKSRSEHVVLAHFIICHLNVEMARIIVEMKRYQIEESGQQPFPFVLESKDSLLVCSKCCTYKSTRLSNVSNHYESCPGIPINVEFCPFNCMVKKSSKYLGVSLSSIVHVLGHWPKKEAMDWLLKRADSNNLIDIKHSIIMSEKRQMAMLACECGGVMKLRNVGEHMKFCRKRASIMGIGSQTGTLYDVKPGMQVKEDINPLSMRNNNFCRICKRVFDVSTNSKCFPLLFRLVHYLEFHLGHLGLAAEMGKWDATHFSSNFPHIDLKKSIQHSNSKGSMHLICSMCGKSSSSRLEHITHVIEHKAIISADNRVEKCKVCEKEITISSSANAPFHLFAHDLEEHKLFPVFSDSEREAIGEFVNIAKTIDVVKLCGETLFYCSKCGSIHASSLALLHHHQSTHNGQHESSILEGTASIDDTDSDCIITSVQDASSRFTIDEPTAKHQRFEDPNSPSVSYMPASSSQIAAMGEEWPATPSTSTASQTPLPQTVTRKDKVSSWLRKNSPQKIIPTRPAVPCKQVERGGSSSTLASMLDGQVQRASLARPKVPASSLFSLLPQYTVGNEEKDAPDVSHIKGVEGLKCRHCQWMGLTLTDFKKHMSVKHPLFPRSETPAMVNVISPCPSCNLSFPSRRKLILHITQAHQDVETPFPCTYCSNLFSSFLRLREHERRVHESAFRNSKGLTCHYCGEKFGNVRNCQEHEKRHAKAGDVLGSYST